ncbi:hypothetical protein J6590_057817 [Homalodisca vitripennis]|nr:hypothetical protein J6590_057817 [Homalodisca vitripennis]
MSHMHPSVCSQHRNSNLEAHYHGCGIGSSQLESNDTFSNKRLHTALPVLQAKHQTNSPILQLEGCRNMKMLHMALCRTTL